MTTLTWELTEANGSVSVQVNRASGPLTGATVEVRFRNPDVADAWLDQNDNTWKTNATVTTLGLALAEVDAVDAPGLYEANLNFAATLGANKPARAMEAIYVVTAPTNLPGDVDVIELVTSYLDVASQADVTAILADTSAMQPLVAANLDAAVSTRATQAQILSDATPFAGADVAAILADTSVMQPLVDVATSTRSAPGDAMALTAAAVLSLVDGVWDEDIVAAHGTADTAGLLLRALGAAISQRGNNPTLDALLGVADLVGVDLPGQIDTVLSAAHGAGLWDAVGAGLTQQQVRDAMKLAPAIGAPAAGSVDEALDNIEADTATMQPLVDVATSTRATPANIAALNDLAIVDVQTALTNQGYTAARSPNLDNLDATITGVPAAADVTLTAAHGVGSWQSGAGIGAQAVRDAMKLAPSVGAPAAGSIDTALDDIEADTAALDLRLPAGPADEALQQASHAATQALIAALNDLSTADVIASTLTALDTQGYSAARAVLIDNLDALVSSRAVPGDAMAVTPAGVTSVWSQAINTVLASGTVGAALAAGSAQGLDDCVDDLFVYGGGPPGQPTTFRRRQFNPGALGTPGSADGADGEIARWTGTASYSGTTPTDTLTSMVLVREL